MVAGISRMAMAALVAALTACADWLAVPANAVPIPQERVMTTPWTQPAAGRVRVGLVRDAEHRFRQDCYDRVYVDEQIQAKLQPKEKLELYLPVGHHVIYARPEGPCPGWGQHLEVDLTSGEAPRWYLIGSGWDGTLYFEALERRLD